MHSCDLRVRCINHAAQLLRASANEIRNHLKPKTVSRSVDSERQEE